MTVAVIRKVDNEFTNIKVGYTVASIGEDNSSKNLKVSFIPIGSNSDVDQYDSFYIRVPLCIPDTLESVLSFLDYTNSSYVLREHKGIILKPFDKDKRVCVEYNSDILHIEFKSPNNDTTYVLVDSTDDWMSRKFRIPSIVISDEYKNNSCQVYVHPGHISAVISSSIEHKIHFKYSLTPEEICRLSLEGFVGLNPDMIDETHKDNTLKLYRMGNKFFYLSADDIRVCSPLPKEFNPPSIVEKFIQFSDLSNS
jgi:hypothetical protein